VYRGAVRKRDLFLIPATLVAACGGTLWGGHDTYVAVTNRAPVEVRCADFARRPPRAAWLRLTDCVPDFESALVESASSHARSVREVYVPLRAEPGARTPIVLASDDDDLLALGDDKAVLGHAVVVELSTSVEGLVEDVVQRGMTLSQRRYNDISQRRLRLTDDFVLFDRGARPRPLWLALGELWIGLSALTLIVRRVRRWFRQDAATLPRATLRRDG
jgi:hypothetical protein